MQRLLNLIGTTVLAVSSTTAAVASISYDKQQINNTIANNQLKNGISTKIQDKITFNENRSLAHSEFKPTGYFLKAGVSYLIHLKKNVPSAELVVGQWGKYQDLNQNDDTFTRYQITDQSHWIKPTNSGMLYIADNNQSDVEILYITSNQRNAVIEVPTFTINQTNQADFINQIRTTNSPFVEFKSKHYFATMQTKNISNDVLPNLQRSFNETLLHWDNVWKWTNEIYGLNENGMNKKSSQYIHIANADTSIGLANASKGRIMFHGVAGKNLFTRPLDSQWALWHESGHTYQTPQYKWSNLTEVTVNISALYIQEKMNLASNIFKDDVRGRLIDYFSQPNRDFNSLTGNSALWIKLAMFWQLHMGFGKNFYPLLNQKYRELNQEPNSLLNFANDKQKIQKFIKTTSEVTGYNLTSFFKYWGLNSTWETKQETSKYKILTAPIWNNILDLNTENNPIIQENLVYTELSDISKITAKNNIVNFGANFNSLETIQRHFNISNSVNINDLKIKPNFEPLKYQEQYYISVILKLSEPNKRPNMKMFLIKINLNNTIMFKHTLKQELLGIFGLDSQNNKLKFYGTDRIMDNTPPARLIYNIQIKTNYGVIIKDINMYQINSFNEIIKKYQLENGISYSDNYQITITDYLHIANSHKYISVNAFNQNNYQEINSDSTTFIIQNNRLIKIN